jgi:RNA polymerase sigma-70 factor, ECF subfamily
MNHFCRLLEAEIPRLRRYARALTRDRTSADDLVQSCLTRAIAKQHLWQPGTDLRAWLFTMLHNRHVSDLRKSTRDRHTISTEGTISMLSIEPDALHVLELRELEAVIAKLPRDQRQAIRLVGLEGMRYDQAASILGIPTGTLRSRLSRTREQLRTLMGLDAKRRRLAADGAQRERRAA